MADTGNKLGTFSEFAVSAAPVDATTLADTAALLCDVLTPGVAAGVEIGIKAYEDNTGAINGPVVISVLYSDLDPDAVGYPTGPTDGPVYTHQVETYSFTPIQNNTVPYALYVPGCRPFKLHILNSSGQELAITANYAIVTIPLAS